MPPDPVTALARKHCLVHSRNPRWGGELCECPRIADAVREALEDQLIRLSHACPSCSGFRAIQPGCDNAIHKAIATLRGGTG